MLTAKQEAFCQHYAVHRKGGEAYRHAYDCRSDIKDASCDTEASKLLAVPEISQRIEAIVSSATVTTKAAITLAEIYDKLDAALAADINELTINKVGACRRCWGVDNKYHWKDFEYLEAMAQWERDVEVDPKAPMPDIGGGFGYRKTAPVNPDCPGCEGEGIRRTVMPDSRNLSPGARLLYGGVKETRNGTEIIIADKSKLLDMLIRMQGGYKDNVRLGGQFAAIVGSVQAAQAGNAEEAARLYQEMCATIGINK